MFIHPVFKGDGKFFMLISQFQDNHCIFTYLEDYKKDPNAAGTPAKRCFLVAICPPAHLAPCRALQSRTWRCPTLRIFLTARTLYWFAETSLATSTRCAGARALRACRSTSHPPPHTFQGEASMLLRMMNQFYMTDREWVSGAILQRCAAPLHRCACRFAALWKRSTSGRRSLTSSATWRPTRRRSSPQCRQRCRFQPNRYTSSVSMHASTLQRQQPLQRRRFAPS